MTTGFRFEHWPEINLDDPDCQRLITSTLPYFDPSVWVFPEGATDQEKIDFITAAYRDGQTLIADNPVTEPFGFKQYNANGTLVGIWVGFTVDNGASGKVYTSSGSFLGEDENGSRLWAKRDGIDSFVGLEEFMNQYGITYFKVAYPENHSQVTRHRDILGFQPDYEEDDQIHLTGTPVRKVVFNLFDIIRTKLAEVNGG